MMQRKTSREISKPRIEELEAILKNAEVVVEDEVDLNKINVGCAVKVYDITFDEEMEFKIVGSTEANSLEGKISNESPVGHALIGKKINDVVDVETQAGVIQYKVLDINDHNQLRTDLLLLRGLNSLKKTIYKIMLPS